MSPQYGDIRPTSGWDRLTSLGHPCKFQLVSCLGSITARHLVVGVSQTLRRWTDTATYIRHGDHHVGHWPTFLVLYILPHLLQKIQFTWVDPRKHVLDVARSPCERQLLGKGYARAWPRTLFCELCKNGWSNRFVVWCLRWQGDIFRENSWKIDVWNLLSSVKIFMQNNWYLFVVKTNPKP